MIAIDTNNAKTITGKTTFPVSAAAILFGKKSNITFSIGTISLVYSLSIGVKLLPNFAIYANINPTAEILKIIKPIYNYKAGDE